MGCYLRYSRKEAQAAAIEAVVGASQPSMKGPSLRKSALGKRENCYAAETETTKETLYRGRCHSLVDSE